MKNGDWNLLKSCVSEIGVKRLCVNQKVGVDANINSFCKVASNKPVYRLKSMVLPLYHMYLLAAKLAAELSTKIVTMNATSFTCVDVLLTDST